MNLGHHENSRLGPQRVKNNPKSKSKSNVKIEGNIENESYPTTWVDPKTVFNAYPIPQNSPLRPQKVKKGPKIKSKSKVRIEGNIENKMFSTRWLTSKQFLNPTPTPKIAY